jgi:hypothetical protein
MARVAVVEHDRPLAQQPRIQEIPHHPARGREPEQPVIALQVDVEADLLRELEQDAAMAVDDRLRKPRRAGAVEHPERVVERHLRERQRSVVSLADEVVPARRVSQPVE